MMRMDYISACVLGLAVTLLYIVPSQAQLGTECSATKLCMSDQTCFYGYCKCNVGFKKNIQHCFPVRGYGQMCYVSAQCTNMWMTCGKLNATDIMSKCICDRLHEWDENSQSCTQTMNMTALLETMTEKYDNNGRILEEAQNVFVGVLIAGLIVIVIGIVSVIGCLIYGCGICRRDEYSFDRPEKFVKIDPEKQDVKSKLESKATYASTQGSSVPKTPV